MHPRHSEVYVQRHEGTEPQVLAHVSRLVPYKNSEGDKEKISQWQEHLRVVWCQRWRPFQKDLSNFPFLPLVKSDDQRNELFFLS